MCRAIVLALVICCAPAFVQAAVPAAKASKIGSSDSEIEADIRARFAKSKINQDHFTVRVQRGVAIIDGSTEIVQRKGVATRLARLGGAKDVDNRIKISEEARKKASERLAEGRKRKAALKARSESKPARTEPRSQARRTPEPVVEAPKVAATKPTVNQQKSLQKHDPAEQAAVAPSIPRARVRH